MNPGNAEELDSAKEVDGALDTTAAKDHLFQPKLQDFLLLTEKARRSETHVFKFERRR